MAVIGNKLVAVIGNKLIAVIGNELIAVIGNKQSSPTAVLINPVQSSLISGWPQGNLVRDPQGARAASCERGRMGVQVTS